MSPELEAGRELDVLVAERIFGSVEAHAPCGDGLTRTCEVEAPTLAECDAMIRANYPTALANGMKIWPAEYIGPNYSEDVAAAFLVVEAIAAKGFHWKISSPFIAGESWHAGFTEQGSTGWNGRPDHRASAPTAPLAICRAALAWSESDSGSLQSSRGSQT